MNDTALVKRDDAIFRVMDKLDEQAYLDELKGRVVDSWVYHFTQEGKELWGLSKVGIDEASSELAKAGEVIRELDMQVLNDPDADYERYVVKAGRFAVKLNAQTGESHEILLETVFGTKRQCKTQTLRNGRTAPNGFYFEHGTMKAARNARARLIPVSIKAKIIAFAKEQGKVRTIKHEEVSASEGNRAPTIIPANWPKAKFPYAGKPITGLGDGQLTSVMEGLRVDPSIAGKAKEPKYQALLDALENELERRIEQTPQPTDE